MERLVSALEKHRGQTPAPATETDPALASLREAVSAAASRKEPLRICGGGSKSFYGRPVTGQSLDLSTYTGIVAYEPAELVITARAGTPLIEVEQALAEQGQMLAFEPPHFGPQATLGGTIACGFSGPRRPYAGAARDFMLGVTCLNGRGELLRFGGQVMKNVAGFDVSRLMVGALGTLGVLLGISLKVLPRPRAETTLAQYVSPLEAIELMNRWAGTPLPLSATAYHDARLYVRLSGAAAAVAEAAKRLGGETLDHGEEFWGDLREQRLAFFAGTEPLWRLSVPPALPSLSLAGETLVEWGGAQRWLKTQTTAEEVMRIATAHGGHATLFRGGDREGQVFTPLPPATLAVHRRLKAAFDPEGIFNPGAMYAEL